LEKQTFGLCTYIQLNRQWQSRSIK